MAQELEKKIIGKWVEVKNISRDIHAILDYFKMPTGLLKSETEKLAAAVELGILEYKKNLTSLIFRALGDARYKSLTLEMISNLKVNTTLLLYITLLQHLLTADLVKLDENTPAAGISADNIEINLILKDILERIKNDPEFSKKTSTKNILVQFSIYKNERETLKKLSPNIKNKTDTFYQNFKATFEKIFASIRKNYESILKEDMQQYMRHNILRDVQDKRLTALLLTQIKEECRLLSTLEFVSEEKYKTREILVKLADLQQPIFNLFEKEYSYYQEKSAGHSALEKNVISICNGFNKEIITMINKHLEN